MKEEDHKVEQDSTGYIERKKGSRGLLKIWENRTQMVWILDKGTYN